MKTSPKLIIAALLAAFIAAITLFIRVPIPKSGGYLNLGDIIVVFCGLYLGPVYGAFAGGVGSAVADAFGYPIFVVPTLIIKGLEGLFPGLFAKYRGFGWLGCVIGAVVMVLGYYLAESVIFAGKIGKAAAITELPFNAIQGAVGAIGGYALYRIVKSLTRAQEATDAEE